MYKILIVDDEAPMRQLLKIYLTNAGYTISEASNGEVALSEIEAETYHMIILDLMMPGMSGWEACKEIRAIEPELPILMLTARTSIEDKVQGLSMGADDYLTKPFDGRELVARVQSLLRRSVGTETEPYHIRALNMTIEPEQKLVSVHGIPLALTQTEFDILWLLAKRPERTFTREELLERIWGLDFDGDIRTVDSHIKNLREKLREMDVDPIATVWGAGYKFVVNTSDGKI
ncbi:response regulator transcription factor [Ferroacidibacillus organovorans]|uniref:response regulator transcription factor n=1 Tax=Ferroacidibacillus organovorans TaxID=1765683 RepID=UPI001F2624BD|nr:response regulator transcription factor [Ferroacidibacillus organovorans]